MNKVDKFCTELEEIVNQAYECGVTLEDAERLAARMLSAQLAISNELEVLDLDSRMRENGIKTVEARAYMEELAKHDKKPAEAYLQHAINLNPLVVAEEDAHIRVDTRKNNYIRYFKIFTDAHLYFRGIAKGSFGG